MRISDWSSDVCSSDLPYWRLQLTKTPRQDHSMTQASFRLIFVAGSMRSGTTLLQQLLCTSPAANPFVHGCRYLVSHLGVYANYAGADRLYVDDYLGGPKGLFDFTKELLRSEEHTFELQSLMR